MLALIKHWTMHNVQRSIIVLMSHCYKLLDPIYKNLNLN
jgi:hypothetical protein